MKKAIIVGALPLEAVSFLNKAREEGFFLVACDGGQESFIKAKIEPDLLVGDFDTFDRSRVQNPKELIELNTHKDDTDTLVALKYLLAQNYDEFHLFGCLGGKVEHTIANFQLIYFLTSQHKKAYLYSQDNQTIVHMIFNSCIRLKAKNGGKFSLFSYNSKARGVTITGAMYELHDATLSNDTPLGISNELIGKEVNISVKDGTLLLVLEKDSIAYEP